MVTFEEFVQLKPTAVRDIVRERGQPLGVAMPFNGTRRWYLKTYNKQPQDILTEDYRVKNVARIREILTWVFADGVHSVYTPILGHDLLERGEQYMQFATQGIQNLTSEAMLTWYKTMHIMASTYGQTQLLPQTLQDAITATRNTTQEGAECHLHYGVFADRATQEIIQHTLTHYQEHGSAPTPEQLTSSYYGAPTAPVEMWIGSDQPTVFDVPLVFHGNTALYFLQYPTHDLSQWAWRRILYDYLFIRGDDETLYPDNITPERQIVGIGTRQNGYWQPAQD